MSALTTPMTGRLAAGEACWQTVHVDRAVRPFHYDTRLSLHFPLVAPGQAMRSSFLLKPDCSEMVVYPEGQTSFALS